MQALQGGSRRLLGAYLQALLAYPTPARRARRWSTPGTGR
jgi:hypothetical protein